MRGFAQHELPVNSNISQVWTCPYRPWRPQRPGLYPDRSCVLLYCLSQTCIPRAAIRPGHVTDQTAPFQLQLTQEQLGCQPSRQSPGYPMTVADRKLRRKAASAVWLPFQLSGVLSTMLSLVPPLPPSGSHRVVQADLGVHGHPLASAPPVLEIWVRAQTCILLAYLFDSTLEACLLVLHPVDLPEGASAHPRLACHPVDLFSVLIIHWFEFLGLKRRRRSVSMTWAAGGQRATVGKALQPRARALGAK